MDVRNIKTIDFGLSIVYAKKEEKAHRDREKEGLDGTVYRPVRRQVPVVHFGDDGRDLRYPFHAAGCRGSHCLLLWIKEGAL